MRPRAPAGGGVLLAVALSLAGSGCRQAGPARETLLIAGSSAVKSYLDPVVAEFSRRNPEVSVISEGGGSVAAVLTLKQNGIDIAALSRMVETDLDDNYLRDYQITRDGVAVVVSEASPMQGLTLDQVTAIFSGKVTNWKDVGGPEAPIVVYRKPSTSHSHRSFTTMVLDGDEPFRGARIASTSKELIADLQADPHAVGYMSMGNLKGVKALEINGVPLTRATALSGRYPLSRAFYLAVYGKANPVAERFVEFALSADGQKLLADDGLIPVR
jgi:phosphate transport system substrate-binding protein